MKNSNAKAFLALIAIMTIGDMIIVQASTIQCYICNTDEHSGCGIESPTNPALKGSCSDDAYDRNQALQPMCSKSVVKDYSGGGEPVIEVYRQCFLGNLYQKGNCQYEKVGNGVEKIECVCNGDSCNGAMPSNSQVPYTLMALSVVSAFTALLRN